MTTTLLLDVLAAAIGTTPTMENARAAALDRKFDLRGRMLASYEAAGALRIPEKPPAEFYPAWLLDYRGSWSTPYYRRQLRFVMRAILYAHRLGVVNPLHFLADDILLDDVRLAECAEQIVQYGPLEGAGLLFYVSPVEPRTEYWNRKFPDNLLASYEEFLLRHEPGARGILSGHAHDAYPLGPMLAQLDALLRACEERRDSIDLFLPGWFPFAPLLSWLGSVGGPLAATLNADAAFLTTLLTVPTLNPEGYTPLSTRDLVLVRESGVFQDWRTALSAELTGYALASATGPDAVIAAEAEFRRALGSQAERLSTKLRSQKPFRQIKDEFNARLTLGVAGATAAASAFSGSDAAVTAATGVAGGIAGTLPAMVTSIRRWLRAPDTEAALERHFRVFAAE